MLVHGYATPPRKATEEYRAFTENVRTQTSLGRLPEHISIARVYWPGSDPNWFYNKASFSSRVGAAGEAGRRLSQALTDSGATELIVVGHSLGCHAVLELLATREVESSVAPVRLAFLMAAAVPEDACRPDGVFARALMQSPIQVALHSKRDFVLKAFFRPGMRLARRGWTRAVGSRGGPMARWDRTAETKLGHTDYWESREAARQLATQLGLADDRPLPMRSVQSHRTDEATVPERHPTFRTAPQRAVYRWPGDQRGGGMY